MQVKKNPKARLENYSKLFVQIGLVLTLFVIYQLLEVKTYESSLKNLGEVSMSDEDKEDIPIVIREEIIIPKNTPPPLPEKIKIVENELDIEETVIKDTETDENEAVIATIDPNAIVEEDEDEEIVEDVPFLVIEDVPVYPGCSGNKQELKDCFTEKVRYFFVKHFNTNLAQELGLSQGKKRIIVLFIVDKTGKVTNVMARAPHPKIQKEVVSVIEKLPQMTPGRQRGNAVGVRYSLPIAFLVK